MADMEHDAPSQAFQNGYSAGYAAGRRSVGGRKSGRWKGAGLGDYECTACWEVCSGGDRFNYCPWCGADMRGNENGK